MNEDVEVSEEAVESAATKPVSARVFIHPGEALARVYRRELARIEPVYNVSPR